MANFGDFKGVFDRIISLLKSIDRSLHCLACASGSGELTEQQTFSGTNENIGDLSGFKSFVIVKTSPNTDIITVSTSDGNTYTMTEQGEVFGDASTTGSVLPEIVIGGDGTFKYHGIK